MLCSSAPEDMIGAAIKARVPPRADRILEFVCEVTPILNLCTWIFFQCST